MSNEFLFATYSILKFSKILFTLRTVFKRCILSSCHLKVLKHYFQSSHRFHLPFSSVFTCRFQLHLVILSSCHLVVLSSCHLVTFFDLALTCFTRSHFFSYVHFQIIDTFSISSFTATTRFSLVLLVHDLIHFHRSSFSFLNHQCY